MELIVEYNHKQVVETRRILEHSYWEEAVVCLFRIGL